MPQAFSVSPGLKLGSALDASDTILDDTEAGLMYGKEHAFARSVECRFIHLYLHHLSCCVWDFRFDSLFV